MRLRRNAARRPIWRAAGQPVDAAVVLAVDCSGSIRNESLALQFRGYRRAVTSDAFLDAVRSGLHARVALAFVTWSSADRQEVAVPWSLIDTEESARRFAALLADAPAPIPGYTSISGAIDFAARLLAACPYAPLRRIIDVSGDGTNNDGRAVAEARDEAVAQGLVINGLPILGQEPDVVGYYRESVIGGADAFLVVADDPARFEASVARKLIAEVADFLQAPRRLLPG
ncbi:MAG: DUF1194 domain-containing protein [Proteobacteria bacterium]|nr:DUF1194 domain-containing protein [Pseudomonadota bacterium]